mgnify:CR=1 FL=1
MSIITLTTDLGIKDHYVAIIKGEIYKQFPDINIVDISHEITKFDIVRLSRSLFIQQAFNY